jgi:hypothetical protein
MTVGHSMKMIQFHTPLWIYAAAGVAILWGKMKASQRNVYALTDIIKALIPSHMEKQRAIVELACYLSIGCIIAMGVIDPATPAQAFAAGLGWTGLTTK